MCLNVIKVSIELGNYVHVNNYISKAEQTPEVQVGCSYSYTGSHHAILLLHLSNLSHGLLMSLRADLSILLATIILQKYVQSSSGSI